MRYLFSLFITISIVFPTCLPALKSRNKDISLHVTPPKASIILGLKFGNTLIETNEAMANMGLKLIEKSRHNASPRLTTVQYSGIPEGFPVRRGQSTLTFYDNQLVRMDLEFPASYRNFLMIRHQLFTALGQRFQVKKKHESMEDRLRTQLAHLRQNEFGKKSESDVIQSMNQGNTFFYYNLTDSKNELNVIYSFVSRRDSRGKMKPKLELHYSDKSKMEEIKVNLNAPKPEQELILPGDQRSF